jgi:hypothetical protein
MAILQRSSAAYELLERVVTLPIRILSSEAIERPDFSSQRAFDARSFGAMSRTARSR